MSDIEGCFAGKMYTKSDNLHIYTAIFPTKKNLYLITNIYVLKEA
jgi:hypothetical protein